MQATTHRVKGWFAGLGSFLRHSTAQERCSLLVMGTGQLLYRQWGKGLLYLGSFLGILYYLITTGFAAIGGFFTLGSVEADPWTGQTGDNSIDMLIYGIFAMIVVGFLAALWWSNVRDIRSTTQLVREGKKPPTFREGLVDLADAKFYKASLFLPVIGVFVFNILPIVFMILIAFTNYGVGHEPPRLVDWVGFENFTKLLGLREFSDTFFKILRWNVLWAVLSTTINYFGGLFLAMLINKKNVKLKKMWRAFPILAYAIPGFISILAFKFMFSFGGPVNNMLMQTFGFETEIGFLRDKWAIRIIGLLVNAWISIPTSMLLATGILSNLSPELEEAARIDGASAFQVFRKITLPFVVFSTTPVLITQFTGNFNNFGIFYFLTGGTYTEGYFLASDSHLLINWLYGLSVDSKYYAMGAALSIVIFLITSSVSLLVYVRSAAYKKEDTYR